MEEKLFLRNKFFLHIIYNIIAFSLIFIVFGSFVFFMVRTITYSSVDNDLTENMQNLKELKIDSTFFMFLPGSSNEEETTNERSKENLENYQDNILTARIKNPKIVMILRDETGEIINTDDLNRFEEYADEINNTNYKILDKIYNINIGDSYVYRTVNFKIEYEDSSIRYVQLLINVDSERDLIQNYGNIISSAVAIGIILSVVASYVLSKYTLKPLEENLIKQTEFVQNASHELRTPLTIIQAKQELLLQEPNAKIIDKSEEIMLTLNETKRLTKLTKDLMTLTRADSQKNNLQKEEVNLDEFIKNLANPYIELVEMQEKTLSLNLKYENDVNIDTNKIYQLIIILLDNAMKYTEKGDSIEINTFLKDNKCVIEVKDTGIGVSDEGLKRIFERFYREDVARSRETGGSGLGLSIASSIVSAHNGTIKASHNSPKGTIFTIRLPR